MVVLLVLGLNVYHAGVIGGRVRDYNLLRSRNGRLHWLELDLRFATVTSSLPMDYLISACWTLLRRIFKWRTQVRCWSRGSRSFLLCAWIRSLEEFVGGCALIDCYLCSSFDWLVLSWFVNICCKLVKSVRGSVDVHFIILWWLLWTWT